MKISSILLCVVFFAAGLLTINSIAQSNRVQRNSTQTNQSKFEYGTLTTVVTESEDGRVYELTWNAGVRDFVAKSASLADARRRLTAQLGVGNNTLTNLSVLLTSLGSDGWRLVETSQDETGNTRIFIRPER